MAYKSCTAKIAANIQQDCNKPLVGGYTGRAVIMSSNDFERAEVVRSADNPRKILSIVLPPDGSVMAYTIDNVFSAPFSGSTTAGNNENGRNGYLKTLSVRVPMRGADVSMKVIEPLVKSADGFVAIFEKRDKVGDGSYEVIGYQNALRGDIAGVTRDESANGGDWIVPLTTVEKWAEVTLVGSEDNYETAKKEFDGLFGFEPQYIEFAVPYLNGMRYIDDVNQMYYGYAAGLSGIDFRSIAVIKLYLDGKEVARNTFARSSESSGDVAVSCFYPIQDDSLVYKKAIARIYVDGLNNVQFYDDENALSYNNHIILASIADYFWFDINEVDSITFTATAGDMSLQMPRKVTSLTLSGSYFAGIDWNNCESSIKMLNIRAFESTSPQIPFTLFKNVEEINIECYDLGDNSYYANLDFSNLEKLSVLSVDCRAIDDKIVFKNNTSLTDMAITGNNSGMSLNSLDVSECKYLKNISFDNISNLAMFSASGCVSLNEVNLPTEQDVLTTINMIGVKPEAQDGLAEFLSNSTNGGYLSITMGTAEVLYAVQSKCENEDVCWEVIYQA